MDGQSVISYRFERSSLGSGKKFLILASVAALAFWCYWWKVSFDKNHLAGAYRTWVPRLEFLGADFLTNYHASRHWLGGGSPYVEPYNDPLNRPYVYSPVLLRLFAWSKYFSASSAVFIWTSALAALASLGAWVAWRTRRRLGLSPVPFLFVLATVLLSTPVLFAMERGNCDLLVLVLGLLAATALEKRSLPRDMCSGVCIALATWIKVYPAFLVLGLIGARRPRAIAFLLLGWLAIGLCDYQGTMQYIRSTQAYLSTYDIGFHYSAHPLYTHWNGLWKDTRFAWMTKIPSFLATGLVLLPVALAVTGAVFRCRKRAPMLMPYLLWLMALGTFAMPVSNDYNLFFLPMAALAAWDRRDPVFVHVLMGMFLFWWQPMQLPISPEMLFILKIVGLYAIGVSVAIRANELAVPAAVTPIGENASKTIAVAA